MQKYRGMLRGKAITLLIDWLVIVIVLTVWVVARRPIPTEQTIPYNEASDHIIVQLAKLPEHSRTQTHTVPMWTLYGDGTLIFRAEHGDSLWRAQLSQREVQHILDVIINQNTFFKSTAQQYGSGTSEKDDDERLLVVDANGQQKKAVLASEPANQVATDSQAAHVFAIKQFLLDYRPLHIVLLVPDSDDE
jgi:hypothetical protein